MDPRIGWTSAVAALCLALAGGPGAWALPAAQRPGQDYDPEIALLVLSLQKESLPLLASELGRQCDWLGLGGVKILLDHAVAKAVREVEKGLGPDSDVLGGLRDSLVRFHPADARDIDELIGEVRRFHGMTPGPPLRKLSWPDAPGASRRLLAETGVGAEIAKALRGNQSLREPVAFAERRFGATGPFLRKRRWNIDFYLGDFKDLLPHYWRLGYRVFYRLRAPYISYSKEAYVLAPESQLQPRLVYCAFLGRDYFQHVRAQYAILARNETQGPQVRTLQCPDCAWSPPSLKALKELLGTTPYTPRNAIMGYAYLFEKPLAENLMGSYENAAWRLRYYSLPSGVTVTLESRFTGFGEISALALEELVRRGVRRIFYAGPAADIGTQAVGGPLRVPDEFLGADGLPVRLRNSLSLRHGHASRHQSVASPLFVTDAWIAAARDRGVQTVDCEAALVAERIAALNLERPEPVELGLAVITSDLSNLHPDEDRAVYTVEYESQSDREKAKSSYVAAVLDSLRKKPRQP